MEVLFRMINARFQSSNTRTRRIRSLVYLLDADLLSSKQRFAGTSSMTSEFAPQIIVRIYDEPSGGWNINLCSYNVCSKIVGMFQVNLKRRWKLKKILEAEYWVPSAEYRVLSTECWVLSAECWVLSAECWVLSAEYWYLIMNTETLRGQMILDTIWQF